MMKIAVMAIALVMGSFAFGQGTEKAKTSPEERALNLTNKMVKQLGLNAEQATQISEINLGIAGKNEGIRNDANMTKEQKQEILLSNNAARMAMYKNVLTAEQYVKAEEMEKLHQERKAARKEAKQAEKGKKATEPAKNTETKEVDEDEL